MSTITYLVVPAVTIMAGKVRLVSRVGFKRGESALRSYREAPDLWQEAGHLNMDGRIVSFSGTREELEYMRADEPLYPPAQYTFERQ